VDGNKKRQSAYAEEFRRDSPELHRSGGIETGRCFSAPEHATNRRECAIWPPRRPRHTRGPYSSRAAARVLSLWSG